ncbi:MAG TPA: hypothetical protein PK691_09125 [Thermomicrobiales bacterium]|nr:hypothetical protein [Thermomicrobiales bacterium]HRA48719.1 hypothetical protein [Thermomicrobiales bacterium]
MHRVRTFIAAIHKSNRRLGQRYDHALTLVQRSQLNEANLQDQQRRANSLARNSWFTIR